MGLSGKVPCTNTFSFSDIFKFNPHPFRMWIEFEGLSHGLKTCHRHVFLTAFRVPPHIPKKRTSFRMSSFLVREMGLEPTRRNHTHLKRACLPFQHSRKCPSIITQRSPFVNSFFRIYPVRSAVFLPIKCPETALRTFSPLYFWYKPRGKDGVP